MTRKKLDPIGELINDDIFEAEHGKKCPYCHAILKMKPQYVDSWYCPNPKCKKEIDS